MSLLTACVHEATSAQTAMSSCLVSQARSSVRALESRTIMT
jgi:hypothetical protein